MTATQKDGKGMVCIIIFVAFLVLLGAVGGSVTEGMTRSL